MSAAVAWDEAKYQAEVQRLALRGFDADCSHYLLLQINDADAARKYLGRLLDDGLVCFGDSARDIATNTGAVSVGFSFEGLKALELAEPYLAELRLKAPEFCEGAAPRALRKLGDSGKSAAEHWRDEFTSQRPEVLLTLHGPTDETLKQLAAGLAQRKGAAEAFKGWPAPCLKARQLSDVGSTKRDKVRTVHFGFRDGLVQPKILASPDPRKFTEHHAGELLLGYENDVGFDRWGNKETADAVARFFRNGSFGVLRQIEQHVDAFKAYVDEQATKYQVTPEYIMAKLCGRWPNGALVLPGEVAEPNPPPAAQLSADFDFSRDTRGEGCPFGAHIRRTNPRNDPLGPPRLRPLFRRGMPYGDPGDKEKGLVGLFFCASIEEQFEHVMSEWVEKNPMGPPTRGRAKDPMAGHNDDPSEQFHVPRQGQRSLYLDGLKPFLTTHGTLYSLFPSRFALAEIARAPAAAKPVATSAARPPLAAASLAASAAAPPAPAGPAAAPPPKPQASSEGVVSIDADTAPADRFCDIVMEGGVTSGIIYSSAVVELAKHYRFQSIGGSSIGAFAAALTAAAEYRRRKGSIEGFQKLAKLPQQLAEEDKDDHRTLLQRLFRPQPGTRRLFAIFLAALGHDSTAARAWAGLCEAVRQYRSEVVIAALLLAAAVLAGPLLTLSCPVCAQGTGGPAQVQLLPLLSWIAALLLALAVAVVVGTLLGIVGDIRRGLVPNGFGLCRGWGEDDASGTPDLAGYLHASIQAVAGLEPEAPPLTFKDLSSAPGGPEAALGGKARGGSINLQVYSTNLSHGRPYRFPRFEGDDMGRLFFRADDLAPYFPAPVLIHLLAHARPYQPESPSDPDAGQVAQDCLELPTDELPIVVAARLALSFPGLVSAVPLLAIDYEPRKPGRQLSECWMSDGGLCSNFPIHLFDCFIPRWPTFGISLQSRGRYWQGQPVWLPNQHRQGRGDIWDRGADRSRPALSRLAGFMISLWKAAWRWNDSTMMRMPGVRDRVVRVFLDEGEGGVNIKMTGKQILHLAERYGKAAAQAFVDKFAAAGSSGWAEHRWVRFNRLLVALREQVQGLAFAAGMDHHTQPLREQIVAATQQAPLAKPQAGQAEPSETPINAAQRDELNALLDALLELESAFAQAGDHKPYIPRPRPSLRVRHPT